MNQIDAWNEFYRRNPRGWGGFADISWITEHLEKGATVLELGAGNGKTLIPLLKHGYGCTAVDFSEAALDRLKERLKRLGLAEDCTLIAADVRNLPGPLPQFDGVVMVHLLNHLSIDEMERLFIRLNELTKCGGLVFSETFGKEDMRNTGDGGVQERDGIIYRYHTREELMGLGTGHFRPLGIKSVRTEKRYGGKTAVREVVRAVWMKECL